MSKVKIGDVFGRLTVVKELEKRSNDGHIRYECKCSCGNVVEVNSKELLNGDTTSCNCYRKEQVKKRYYDATLPDRILSDNINKNNTSGIKGVCFDKSRNKWIAKFQWQGKQYFLGRFNTISEAEKARKEFENKVREKYF
jgi:hypothetical protein